MYSLDRREIVGREVYVNKKFMNLKFSKGLQYDILVDLWMRKILNLLRQTSSLVNFHSNTKPVNTDSIPKKR
jgi:hypothetical protein